MQVSTIALAFLPLAAAAARAQTLTDGRFVVETVATLPPYTPVGVTWAADGRMFVWQKNGVVRVFRDGSLLPDPFVDVSGHVNNVHDRGLLGFALDPSFETNGYAYLLYVYEETGNTSATGPKTGRLTRVQADPANPDRALAGSETVILGSIGTPPCSSQPAGADCIGIDSDSHTVDTLRFAKDGTLFASIGDGSGYQQADPLALRAQSLDHYNGKLLRINPDGSAPPDNPFYDGSDGVRSKVYGYGLRNPFRFSFAPDSGEPIIGDVGWAQREEVDFGHGKNFGWPCYEGELKLADYAALSPLCAGLSSSAVTFPAYRYDHSVGQAITGGVVYSGASFPAEYQGRYFFADYSSDWMKSGVLDASGVLQDVQTFASGLGGAVDIELGPDGALYYVAFNVGEVRRIRFSQATAPIVKASAAPSSGYSPLAVQFSSAGTASPDGSALSYLWDFGDGTSSILANPAHTYSASAVTGFDARLTVTTASGGSGSATARVVVGSLPPTASISSPASGIAVHPGDTVSFEGDGQDPDEALADSAFSWQILLHHENHVHVESTASGRSGSFVVGDHGAGTFYYELVLTVTDSSGLVATRTVRTAVVTSAASYRINAGGPDYTDTLGQLWSADNGFNTGNAATSASAVADPNAPLYESERWDPPDAPELAYHLPVPNGSYRVNLHFAEIYGGAAAVGARVFDVFLEGAKVLSNLDIYKEVGFAKPLVKSFTVTVGDGALDLAFAHVVENPKISAIEVIPTSAPPPTPGFTPIRVNAGGGAFVDASGNAWEADRAFNTGNAAAAATSWTGANPELYSTERWDPPDAPELRYAFAVPSGTYTVNLHFSEIYVQSAGARQFDVLINGTRVLDHLDVYAEVGFMKPLVKSFTVNVSGTELLIDFVHEIENPKIAGIEILAAPPPPPPPSQFTPIRVNAGGAAFVDASGNAWDADRAFNTGNAAAAATSWTGANPDLYSTERWDPPDAPELRYAFAVPAGTYTVKLHFSEIYVQSAGARQFDVLINGTRVLQNLDVYAEVGFMKPLVKTFTVQVSGTELLIDFVHQVENPKIAGIEITQ